MPLPPRVRDDLEVRHRGEHEAAESDRRRDAIVTAGVCVLWSAAGIAMILTSFHMTSALARPLFFAGIAVGNGGIIFTLLAAYRRGENRGDW